MTINRDDKEHKKKSAASHKNSHSPMAILQRAVFLLLTVNNEGRFCSGVKGAEAVSGASYGRSKVLSIAWGVQPGSGEHRRSSAVKNTGITPSD